MLTGMILTGVMLTGIMLSGIIAVQWGHVQEPIQLWIPSIGLALRWPKD